MIKQWVIDRLNRQSGEKLVIPSGRAEVVARCSWL